MFILLYIHSERVLYCEKLDAHTKIKISHSTHVFVLFTCCLTTFIYSENTYFNNKKKTKRVNGRIYIEFTSMEHRCIQQLM